MPARVRVLAILAAALAAGVLLYSVDPHVPGFYPPCPFHWLTGLDCPGCGSLRALHLLLHGDLAGALARNPLTVAVVPFLAYALAAAWSRAFGPRPLPRARLGAAGTWALLATIVAFWLVRNVPGL